jgi:hypothetical protein
MGNPKEIRRILELSKKPRSGKSAVSHLCSRHGRHSDGNELRSRHWHLPAHLHSQHGTIKLHRSLKQPPSHTGSSHRDQKVSQPTEIYLNEEYYYPNGYVVSVVPSKSAPRYLRLASRALAHQFIALLLRVSSLAMQTKAPGKNLLWVYPLPTTADGTTITVTVSPK